VKANRAAHSAVLAGTGEISFRAANFENASDLNELLANLEEIPVHLENAGVPQLRLLIELLNARQRPAPVSTGWNPLANLDYAAEVIAAAPATLVPFTIHGEEFEESGATAVEEVGFTLAAAIDFMAGMPQLRLHFHFLLAPTISFKLPSCAPSA
jgi:methylmalonyl-CoA mutase N-terminal domain/subunit